MENEIRLERRGAVTLFDIKGDITAFSEPFFNEAYKNANDQGANKILLKFHENAYINSAGIAVIIQLLVHSRTNDQQIMITGLSDHFKKIFNMVGITEFTKIFETEGEALECFGHSPEDGKVL